MARAAIVVVPSRWQEPFGLVALEALASGAALICADRGGLREVAGDAAVYVDPDDPAALAAAIRALAADAARRAALGQAGRRPRAPVRRAGDRRAPGCVAARGARLPPVADRARLHLYSRADRARKNPERRAAWRRQLTDDRRGWCR